MSYYNDDKFLLAWVIGLALVTVSAIAAPIGIVLIPLLSKKLYDKFMILLVAVGVGAMSGSVFFMLTPQAYALTDLDSFPYKSKSIIIISAIYAFFAVDRALQIFLELKRRRSAKRKIHVSTIKSVLAESKELKKKIFRRKKKLETINKVRDTVDVEKENLKDELEVQMITNNLVRNVSFQNYLD